MSAEQFFDTNVILYLLSGDRAKADRAEALLAQGGPSAFRCSMSSLPLHRES